MAQYIKQPSLAASIGSGIGRGLAQQLPEEMTRGRLAAGLQNLSQQKGLTPFQQFSALAAIPGITPQMIQSGAELLRQQGIAQGFRNVANQGGNQVGQGNVLQNAANQMANQEGQTPPSTIGTTAPVQATIKPYIPKNYQQLLARAGEFLQEQPQLYPTPDLAMQAAQTEDKQLQAQNQALQAQRTGELEVQNNVRNALNDLKKQENAIVPDNVYQKIENDTLAKVANGKLAELDAAKEAAKELDKISREYNAVGGLGNWTFTGATPSDQRRAIKNLREDFKKRGDLENFADTLVAKNGISYPKAYWQAYNDETPKEIREIIDRSLKLKTYSYEKGYFEPLTNDAESLRVARRIAPMIKGTEASPLAIAEELRMKGYNPDIILNEIAKYKDDLNKRQDRELSKSKTWIPRLNDLWLFIGSGQDRVVEE